MQLQDEFNARDNAILFVFSNEQRHRKNGGIMVASPRYLKLVLGPEEPWWSTMSSKYDGIDDFVEAEVVPLWEAKYGPFPNGTHPAEKLDTRWANSLRAGSLNYDGSVTLTDIEMSVLNAVSYECDLTYEIAWVAIEGMGWRPGMLSTGIEPRIEDIREFQAWWPSDFDADGATDIALTMIAHDPAKGWENTRALVQRMMRPLAED